MEESSKYEREHDFTHISRGWNGIHPIPIYPDTLISTPIQTKVVMNRLSRAIGHLESVKRMVSEERDCSEVTDPVCHLLYQR